ncbi:MAG TPA: S4 domain-containing protein [Candidatus Acidoferrum sp.]|nr:S4 domain-containing protein [Candidatus Acidoferrum sp.]
MEERLQKIIARAGVASRRRAEEMIASGLVTVNGQTVTELGTKADAERDHIKVAGRLLRFEAKPVYLLLNKPPEVVSTMSDPEGRPSLLNFLHRVSERVYPVGRLEYHAAGAVILTNDGEFANAVLQAHELPNTWQFKLQKLLTFEEIETLSRAIGSHIRRLKGTEAPWYEATLSESRREQLRNRLFQTGHPVEKMKRVAIAGVELERLAPGEIRPLGPGEVTLLRRAAAGEAVVAEPSATPAPPSVRPRPQTKPSKQRREFARRGRTARPPDRPARGAQQGRRSDESPRGFRRSGPSDSRSRSPKDSRSASRSPRPGGRPQRPRRDSRRNRSGRPRTK